MLHIDTEPLITKAHQLPQEPGVYRFLNQQKTPVYIGKSINIRQRVLSHLYQANSCKKENKIAQATQSFSYSLSEGEIGALLKESQEVKKHLPLFNRQLRRNKVLLTWELDRTTDYYFFNLVKAHWPPNPDTEYFGLYSSQTQAKNALNTLAKQYQLCKKLLGLEQMQQTCFGFQINQCLGACQGIEPPKCYNARLRQAFEKNRISHWPHDGAIGLSEGAGNQIHLIEQWYFLGTYQQSQIQHLMANTTLTTSPIPNPHTHAPGKTLIDRDTYRILIGAINKQSDKLKVYYLKSLIQDIALTKILKDTKQHQQESKV